MTNKSGDQPAFPCRHEELYRVGGEIINSGMTLREYYAGLAMQGILANQKAIAENIFAPDKYADALAKIALQQADALLAALAQSEKGEK